MAPPGLNKGFCSRKGMYCTSPSPPPPPPSSYTSLALSTTGTLGITQCVSINKVASFQRYSFVHVHSISKQLEQKTLVLITRTCTVYIKGYHYMLCIYLVSMTGQRFHCTSSASTLTFPPLLRTSSKH